MIRFIFTALVLAFVATSTTARADECDDLVPAGQDRRLFADLIEQCHEQAVTASLADAIASGAEADRLRDERLARLEAARMVTPAPASPPSAPAQTTAPTPPAQQQVVYVPQGPVLGQVIPIAVGIGSMPPAGGSVRAGIHAYGFVGARGTSFDINGMVCASDGGLSIRIANGVPIAVTVGSQVVTKLCAPASAELNVYNLAPTARVDFLLYRPSASRYGVYDLYATLSCSGSTRGGMQPKHADGCNITYAH